MAEGGDRPRGAWSVASLPAQLDGPAQECLGIVMVGGRGGGFTCPFQEASLLVQDRS